MEAALSISAKEEMRGVIRFLFSEGIKTCGNYSSDAGSMR
jgi:hypothetical protein